MTKPVEPLKQGARVRCLDEESDNIIVEGAQPADVANTRRKSDKKMGR